ncbi:MAG: DNA methyltransferase [Bacteroidetes bacterium]|nr:DNA methyltransferase [Bacteroidota bacterium]
MRRILKLTGSIYLHCDPTMSHYLKLVMDAIFGRKGFQNEIIWHYGLGAFRSKARYPRKHDVILFYSNNSESPETFNIQRGEPTKAMLNKYCHEDSHGKYMISYGKKYYLKGGKPYDSVWDVPTIASTSSERTGYPTQKPLILLERIIKASTNVGDLIFDPFCGCATTCVAADALEREWIGIDISVKAYQLVNIRLRENQGAHFYEDGSKQSSILENVIHRKDIPQRTDLGKIPIYNCTENKRKLFGDQEGKCNWCEIAFPIQNLDVDHIVAKSKGGTDHIDNLQLLCSHCNRVKGDRGMEYMKKLHSHLKLAA